ncbi:MAG: chloride channel protein [Clostridia bacterium]|nr:chloride channel protein [Clostridia bacterium]
MGIFKTNLKFSWDYLKAFIKWIFVAAVVGGIGGCIGSVFHIAIDYVTELRTEHSWILYLLPVGGLVIAAIYGIFKKKGKLDTNRVLEAVATEEKVPLVMAPLIFVSTVLTHLLGGSAGREGAALQLGGSIGYNVGKVFRLNQNDMHIIVMAGMSAVFAALFGTPLTAAVFALEVVCVGVMHYAALVPCVISAMVAFGIACMFGLSPVHFDGVVLANIDALLLGKIVVIAVLCALVSILFCTAIHYCEHSMEKLFKNKYLRAFVGAVVIVLLTLLVGTRDYNGAGMDVITRAIGGAVNWEAFLLKIVFTAITIAAGFKGGEIVPAFFIGSTFGCLAGSLLGMDAGFAAAVGFVAVFCGVVNCPLASTMLALEVFGSENILIFALVCAISYMMSGSFSLYKSQKIVYSKLDAHYIDIDIK